MDSNSSIIPYLFLITFVIALALGVMQYMKARKAKAEHHRSASAEVKGEPYAAAGSPGKGESAAASRQALRD